MKNIDCNYIVVSNDGELYDYVYRDLNHSSYTYFDNHFPKNKILKILMKISFSRKLNRFINVPFKRFWIKYRAKYYKRIFEQMPVRYKNKCIVLFSDCIPFEKYHFSEMLKKIIPDVKIVYFFQDIISADTSKIEFLNHYKENVDLIYSFDNNDAKNYNLEFYNVPYSNITLSTSTEFDICFVGKAKDRLDEIIRYYEFFKSKGMKLDFWIIDVEKSKQKYSDEINYSEQISYADYLKIISKSRCILEIIQKNSTGNTLRVDEAIIFDKILLSNNTNLYNNIFYDSSFMFVIDKIEEFDVEKVTDLSEVEYKYKDKVSPFRFLDEVGYRLYG